MNRMGGLRVVPLGYRVWDTARLLSEKSLAGGFLSGLIGYPSQPSLPGISVYIAYLIASAVLLFGHRTPVAVGLADPTRP